MFISAKTFKSIKNKSIDLRVVTNKIEITRDVRVTINIIAMIQYLTILYRVTINIIAMIQYLTLGTFSILLTAFQNIRLLMTALFCEVAHKTCVKHRIVSHQRLSIFLDLGI